MEKLVREIVRLMPYPLKLLQLAEQIPPPDWNKAFFQAIRETRGGKK
jgi:hypothetical protein